MIYSTRRFVVCLTLCHFVFVFFSPFSIAITSFRKERANLCAFRTFVRFVLVWICRFSLSLGVSEGLRFVIVALPGLFSYLFFLPCVILFLCFSVLLALRLPRLGKRELILVLFVRLFDLCLFGFVDFLFLLVSGEGYGLWLWHSLTVLLHFFQCLETLGSWKFVQDRVSLSHLGLIIAPGQDA